MADLSRGKSSVLTRNVCYNWTKSKAWEKDCTFVSWCIFVPRLKHLRRMRGSLCHRPWVFRIAVQSGPSAQTTAESS